MTAWLEPPVETRRYGPTAAVSGIVIRVLAAVAASVILVRAGLLPGLSIAAAAALLLLGGVLLVAAISFVRYYGDGEGHLFRDSVSRSSNGSARGRCRCREVQTVY